jgi:hypothetical protein
MSDLILETWVSGLIEPAKLRCGPGAREAWTPGKKLKRLNAGFNGPRNTGEEARVHEMYRQFRRVLGEQNVHLAVLALNPEFPQGYNGDTVQVRSPFEFPPFLYREVPRYGGVTSCGAMFMSKFSSASIMMIEALSIASAHGNFSIAYGGESRKMDPMLAQRCSRYRAGLLMIIRNEESRAILQKLDLPSQVGADTAWTLEPLDSDFG